MEVLNKSVFYLFSSNKFHKIFRGPHLIIKSSILSQRQSLTKINQFIMVISLFIKYRLVNFAHTIRRPKEEKEKNRQKQTFIKSPTTNIRYINLINQSYKIIFYKPKLLYPKEPKHKITNKTE